MLSSGPRNWRSKGWIFSLAIIGVACCSSEVPAGTDGVCRLQGSPASTVDSAKGLYEVFDQDGGSLEALRASGKVPALQVDRLPDDLDALPARRVDLFLRLLLPSALQVNQGLSAERARLLALPRTGERSQADEGFLKALSNRYGAPSMSVSELIERVDEVPVSLILAQGADESGWGRSRFAIAGNALFGQHTSGKGPASMEARGADVRMAAFANVCAAVQGYVDNLNQGRAYAGLRSLRARLRAEGRPVTGAELAGELLAYSARGAEYVGDLRSIIRRHGLEDFNRAVLTGRPGWVKVVPSAR